MVSYRRKQKGGTAAAVAAAPTGVDIRNIGAFSPASLPGLVLWIKAERNLIKTTKLADYAQEQLPLIRTGILQTLGSKLQESVVTEIVSDTPSKPNSLVRLELQEDASTRFPTLIETPNALPRLDVSSYTDSATGQQQILKLVTKEPIDLPAKFSFFTIADGLQIQHVDALDKIVVRAATMEIPATFHEIIIYNRELSVAEKQSIEGYLTYKSNQQWKLPVGHPFLPDLSENPAISAPVTTLKKYSDTIRKAETTLTDAVNTYIQKAGKDAITAKEPTIRGLITDSLHDIETLKQVLSKGAIMARYDQPPTLETVYKHINTEGLYPVNLDDKQFALETQKFETATTEIAEYLKALGAADVKSLEQNWKINAAIIDAARKEAETDEGLRTLEFQVSRREIIQKQRTIRREIVRLGNTLLNTFYDEFLGELDLCKESFDYQAKRREDRFTAVDALLKPLRLKFADDSWVNDYSFLDKAKDDTGSFRDPLLKGLAAKFQTIKTVFETGDALLLRGRLDAIAAEAKFAYDKWKLARRAAVMRSLYVSHLRSAFDRAEHIQHDLDTALDSIETAIKSLTDEMTHLKTFQKVTIDTTLTTTSTQAPEEKIYYAELTYADMNLLEYTHLRVNQDGTIYKEANDSAEEDIVFVFPETLKGAIVTDPLKESVLDSIPSSRFPKILKQSVTGRWEVPRTYMNSILRLDVSGAAAEPILLPKYAVRAKTFLLVQNSGAQPLYVRNPGAIEDAIHCVGPAEVALFFYGEGTSLSSSPGFAYGVSVWEEDLLPYDVLNDTPRSAYAVHIKELGKSVYVLRPSRPLLDKNGYLVEPQRASDGSVYDPDDFSLTNPYSVQTLPEATLADLVSKGKGITRPVGAKVVLRKEASTGLALLCSERGVPVADEFGYCKVAATPIVNMDGTLKLKGATGDLIVTVSEATDPIDQIYKFEPGLNFDALFRTRFSKPLKTDFGNAPVFVTSLHYPICAATGEYIYLPANTVQQQDLLTYEDPNGKKQAFVVDGKLPIESGKAVLVPYVDINAITQRLKDVQVAVLVLERYGSSIEYVKSLLQRMDADVAAVKTLGEEMTASFRASVEDTKKRIQERLDAFKELQATMDGLAKAIAQKEIPNEVLISLGILDIQLRDKILEINELYNSVQDSLDAYELLISRIDKIRKIVARLRSDGTALFKKGYEGLQTVYRSEAARTKSVSVPAVEAQIAKLKALETEFMEVQAGLETVLADQPPYLGELRNWVLDLQRDSSKQVARLEGVKSIVITQLPALLLKADTDAKAAATTAETTLLAAYEQQKARLKRLALFFGVWTDLGEQAAYNAATVEEGSPNERGPFLYVKAPVLERDLASIGATGSEWLKFQSEIAAAKDAIMPLLDITFAPKRTIDGGIDIAHAEKELQDIEGKISAFESGLIAGAFTTFENAVKQTLEDMKATIAATLESAQAIVERIDSKRLAIETSAKIVSQYSAEAGADSSTISNILANISQVPYQATLDTMKNMTDPIRTGVQKNPILVAPIIKSLDNYLTTLKEQESKVDSEIQSIQTLSQNILSKLQAAIDESKPALEQEVESLRKMVEAGAASQTLVDKYQAKIAPLWAKITALPAVLTFPDAIAAMTLRSDLQAAIQGVSVERFAAVTSSA